MSRSVLGDLSNTGDTRRKNISYSLKTSSDVSSQQALHDKSRKLMDVAEKLTSSGCDYTLSSTQMMFLSRLIEGKDIAIAQPDLTMESAAQSRFLDMVEKFQREAEEYAQVCNELECAKKTLREVEINNETPQSKSIHSIGCTPDSMAAELKQSEEILSKLRTQQDKLDELILEKRMRRDQAQTSLDFSVEDALKSSTAAVHTFGDKFRSKSSAEENEFIATLKRVQDQRDNNEALLEGLRVLTGIQSLKVPKDLVRVHSNRLSSNNFNSAKSVKDQMILPITVELGDITTVLTLDDNLRLISLELIKGDLELDGQDFNREKRSSLGAYSNSNTSEVLSRILDEAKALPAPQDIRYAIFALGCAQNSPQILRAHISDLRKKCIVRSTGPLSAAFTLSTGVTVSIAVHDCYPNVPGGIIADSMVGVGGWTQLEIDAIKNAVNSKGFSTIMEVFDYLLSPDAFGK